MYIGTKIKELRKQKGLTLKELSEQSGVQIATLSRIENLKMTGTLESHMTIAKVLGVDITQLYSGILNRESALQANRQKASSEMFVHSDKSSFEMLTTNVLAKRMMPVLLKIQPKGKTIKEQNPAGSERFIFVLDGKVSVRVGKETFPLARNNTLYFDASLEHWIENTGGSVAKIISVITPVSL